MGTSCFSITAWASLAFLERATALFSLAAAQGQRRRGGWRERAPMPGSRSRHTAHREAWAVGRGPWVTSTHRHPSPPCQAPPGASGSLRGDKVHTQRTGVRMRMREPGRHQTAAQSSTKTRCSLAPNRGAVWHQTAAQSPGTKRRSLLAYLSQSARPCQEPQNSASSAPSWSPIHPQCVSGVAAAGGCWHRSGISHLHPAKFFHGKRHGDGVESER